MQIPPRTPEEKAYVKGERVQVAIEFASWDLNSAMLWSPLAWKLAKVRPACAQDWCNNLTHAWLCTTKFNSGVGFIPETSEQELTHSFIGVAAFRAGLRRLPDSSLADLVPGTPPAVEQRWKNPRFQNRPHQVRLSYCDNPEFRSQFDDLAGCLAAIRTRHCWTGIDFRVGPIELRREVLAAVHVTFPHARLPFWLNDGVDYEVLDDLNRLYEMVSFRIASPNEEGPADFKTLVSKFLFTYRKWSMTVANPPPPPAGITSKPSLYQAIEHLSRLVERGGQEKTSTRNGETPRRNSPVPPAKPAKQLRGAAFDKRVAELIREDPSRSSGDIATIIGCAKSTVTGTEPFKRHMRGKRAAAKAAGETLSKTDDGETLDDLIHSQREEMQQTGHGTPSIREPRHVAPNGYPSKKQKDVMKNRVESED